MSSSDSTSTNEIIREEIRALQRSVALLQSYVVKIASFLESQKEEKKKRKQYIEVGYRGSY